MSRCPACCLAILAICYSFPLFAQSDANLDTVHIHAGRQDGVPVNEMIVVSGRSITVDQSRKFPAAVNDPARVAMSFAGVVGNDDARNEIVVRGNNPKGIQWRIEGIEVANPNHFAVQGATGGGITALSANVLGTSDFMTGAFPAEFGNAMSGVFDLRLRKGDNQIHRRNVQAGVLGLDFAAEGPIAGKGRSSYLANYRYSTLDILNRLGLRLQGDEANSFQDLSFKLHSPIDSVSVLSVWGLGGLSRTRIGQPDFQEDFKSNRMIGGMNYSRSMMGTSHIELAGAVSLTCEDGRYENVLYGASDRHLSNAALRLSALYEKRFGTGGSLRGGFVWSRLGFNALGKEFTVPGRATLLDNRGSTQTLQSHVQYMQRIGEKLTILSGVHSLGYQLIGEVTLEPRIGLQFKMKERESVSFGAGIYSRAEPLPTYMARVPAGEGTYVTANRKLKLNKSAHVVLSYRLNPLGRFHILAEAYYQYHYHIPVGPPGTRNARLLYHSHLNETGGIVFDSLSSAGTGKSYGIELTAEKPLGAGFYFLATTSVYRSGYVARDGQMRLGRFSAGFAQNILLGNEWSVGRKKQHRITFGAKLVATGGNRVIPVNLPESIQSGRTVRLWHHGYAEQLPVYFRVDSRVGFSRNRLHFRSTWSVDIQNVTNRRNALDNRFSPASGKIEKIQQAGLIPVLSYRLEF